MQYLPSEKICAPEAGDADEIEEEITVPAWVEKVDGIDTQAGIASHGGDVAAYLDTLQVYAGSYDKYADEIRDYHQAGDIANTTIKIHALKSTMRVIGATELGEVAQRLEDAGKAGDTGMLDAELEDLLAHSRTIGAALAPLLEQQEKEADDSDLPQIDEEKLREYIEAIRHHAGECDEIGIEDILEEMADYRLPEAEKERLNRIRQALDEFDFEAVNDALA